MPIGPATRRFIAARRNPSDTALVFMMEIEQKAKSLVAKAIAETLAEEKKAIGATVEDIAKSTKKQMDAHVTGLINEFKRAFREKIESLPAIKGDPGRTPRKGVDYFDGDSGEPGYTPIAGKDYPSLEMYKKDLIVVTEQVFRRLIAEGMTKKQIQDTIAGIVKTVQFDFGTIARGLETLRGTSQLSYRALKDTPALAEGTRHTLHRGGTSKQTYFYDLSDLCDGVTKTFAVPANTRIVSVSCTDAPAGVYRPLVDWTGTGTQLLTLTGEVAAPTRGATLYILYVV